MGVPGVGKLVPHVPNPAGKNRLTDARRADKNDIEIWVEVSHPGPNKDLAFHGPGDERNASPLTPKFRTRKSGGKLFPSINPIRQSPGPLLP